MPIYDFKCRECGSVTEVLTRNSRDQSAICPNCGSDNLERLITASYVIRSGSTAPGTTCCGATERCETPSCSTEDGCRRK